MLLKGSIPYIQVLRVKRICLIIENYKLYCSELNKHLLRKGTNLTFLINTFQQSKNLTVMKC